MAFPRSNTASSSFDALYREAAKNSAPAAGGA